MFSQPTVFVVGAGASAEFGMPSGAVLKQRIGVALDFRPGPSGTIRGDNDLHALLSKRFTTNTRHYLNAAIELSRMIREFHFDSIDEVLHWFSSSPDTVEIGKTAIVREMLNAERNSTLFNVDDPRWIPDRDRSTTWLPQFLSMMVGSLKKEDIVRGLSNLTIVNFNYDRTVEHFLFSELQTKLGLEEAEAKDLIANLKMVWSNRESSLAGSRIDRFIWRRQ
jgi:hypothetical protein